MLEDLLLKLLGAVGAVVIILASISGFTNLHDVIRKKEIPLSNLIVFFILSLIALFSNSITKIIKTTGDGNKATKPDSTHKPNPNPNRKSNLTRKEFYDSISLEAYRISDLINGTLKEEKKEEKKTSLKSVTHLEDKLEIISTGEDRPANFKKNNLNSRRARISEPSPENGMGLIILRTTNMPQHRDIFLRVDGIHHSRLPENYDSNLENPNQIYVHLTPGVHTLTVEDGDVVMYERNVTIEKAITYLKTFEHPYPYGPDKGRLKILPNESFTPCIVEIHQDSRHQEVLINEIGKKALTFDLVEGSYSYVIKPIKKTHLSRTARDGIYIRAGHLFSVQIDNFYK